MGVYKCYSCGCSGPDIADRDPRIDMLDAGPLPATYWLRYALLRSRIATSIYAGQIVAGETANPAFAVERADALVEALEARCDRDTRERMERSEREDERHRREYVSTQIQRLEAELAHLRVASEKQEWERAQAFSAPIDIESSDQEPS